VVARQSTSAGLLPPKAGPACATGELSSETVTRAFLERIDASTGGQTITAERTGTPTERVESVAEFSPFIRKNRRYVPGAPWLDDPELSARDMLHISSASAVDQIGQSSIRINALDVGIRYPCRIA
jgi:hypothetical protein